MKGLLRISVIVLSLGLLAGNAEAQVISSSSGQDTTTAAVPEQPVVRVIKKRPKPLRTELSGGLRINTDGWSIFMDKGWVIDPSRSTDKFYTMRIVQVEFSEKKHPKEIKRNNNLGSYSDERSRPFIFGKVNNFYSLKFGYGFRKMIAGKPEPGTVSIHWVYLGGLSLGMLKPYYVDAYVPQDNSNTFVQETIKYTDSTKEPFLTHQYIIGSAGWSEGLNEIKFVPGLHAKTGLHFDFANNKRTKLAVEVGISGELYTQNIVLMANQKQVPYLLNMYASFQFGKRW